MTSERSGVVKYFRRRALVIRNSDQIAAELASIIRHVYQRPSMWARVDDIERTLGDFHLAWSIVHESEERFRELRSASISRHDASAGLFSRFKYDNPNATDDEALAFTLGEYRTISLALGVPLEV
ncbi:hypothetical protein OAG71_02965 [bacterium]|nr:hypothetical protein [bacterium]